MRDGGGGGGGKEASRSMGMGRCRQMENGGESGSFHLSESFLRARGKK